MKRFENKTVIITGGSSGIGKAASIKFAKEGANVVIWDTNDEQGNKLVMDLVSAGLKADFYKVDVTNMTGIENVVSDILSKYKRIDILINNAGITKDSSLLKMTSEQWQQVIDVNLTGVFNCTKAIAPNMVENKQGKIINTSSVVGIYGNFGQTNYVASKAGIIGMTKVWARELGRKGITVNAVAPGFIATEMVKAMPENVLKGMQDKTPVGRLGAPEDIANAYAFLASDEAAFINGIVLSIDGGLVN